MEQDKGISSAVIENVTAKAVPETARGIANACRVLAVCMMVAGLAVFVGVSFFRMASFLMLGTYLGLEGLALFLISVCIFIGFMVKR